SKGGKQLLVCGSPGKLLHLHVDMWISALEFGDELRDHFALAAHGPEAKGFVLGGRGSTAAEQNDEDAEKHIRRFAHSAHRSHGTAFRRYRLSAVPAHGGLQRIAVVSFRGRVAGGVRGGMPAGVSQPPVKPACVSP